MAFSGGMGAAAIGANMDKGVSGQGGMAPMPFVMNPVKTYDIISPHYVSDKHRAIEDRRTRKTIYWVGTRSPHVQIHQESEEGPVIATCSVADSSSGDAGNLSWALGEPKVDSSEWHTLQSGGVHGPYTFRFGEKTYRWSRTHNKSLGASLFGKTDFKLVDVAAEDEPLAAYITDKVVAPEMRAAQQVAHVRYFVDLGAELELVSFATALGIFESVAGEKKPRSRGGKMVSFFGGNGTGLIAFD